MPASHIINPDGGISRSWCGRLAFQRNELLDVDVNQAEELIKMMGIDQSGVCQACLRRAEIDGYPEGSVRESIVGCARCHGPGHENLLFKKLTNPISAGQTGDGREIKATHWSMCPVVKEPILMAKLPKREGAQMSTPQEATSSERPAGS